MAPPPALADAIIANLSVAVYTCDPEGYITWYNAAAAELWGRAPQIGKQRWCGALRIYRINGTVLPVEESLMAATLRAGQAVEGAAPMIIERPDGMRRLVLPQVRLFCAPDGKVAGAVNLLVAISDGFREGGDPPNAQGMTLAGADERIIAAKERFLAMLSHELRTPLAPVLITVAGMEADPYLPERMRSDIVMVRRNLELESRLIDDLLDFGRLASGRLQLNPERVALNEALRQVCALCRAPIIEKHLRFDVALDPEAGDVFADPARLQQVMWNLLKNAVKFTPEGGSVWVRTEKPRDGMGAFEVRDSGIGIAPEGLPRVFDAFEQGEERVARTFGGLGLGLAIAKSLVEQTQGVISAHSEGPGAGATFRVAVPMAPALAPALPDATGAPARTSAPIHLLLVEDHEDTAFALAKCLDASGFTVKRAAGAVEAFKMLCTERFDLVMSDIGLPDATGYDLMKRIRKRWNIAGIAMSGYGMEEDIRKSREAGFSEHLVKPVKMTQLEAVIHRVLH